MKSCQVINVLSETLRNNRASITFITKLDEYFLWNKLFQFFIPQGQYGGVSSSYPHMDDGALNQQYQRQIMQQDSIQAKMQQQLNILETEAYTAALNTFSGKYFHIILLLFRLQPFFISSTSNGN